MNVDIELTKQAIYWRGLFINRYSGIEYAIAELVSRAALHPAYSALGLPSFGPTKKLKKLRQIINEPGPISIYRDQIQDWLDNFSQFEEHRHFMAHAIMVAKNPKEILFRMYDHRVGAYSVGELRFELHHLEALADKIQPISSDFTELVAKICREIPLPQG